jgi:small subunit ribosomal protein S19e
LPTPYDVSASLLIEKLAKYLKDNVDEIKPPAWSFAVKTGTHAENPPQDPDWWFIRSASLLRKIYMKEPIGIMHLRPEYGGRKRFGVKPQHARLGGGSNIRKILQQLESAGLVTTIKGRGRKLTSEGRKLLDRIATEILKEKEKEKTKGKEGKEKIKR